jgi:glycosyltransferase involved in cell wall biosynthesis
MKISVLTVCYNSENTIRDTITSVLSQKNVDIEYIIIDGGSSDRTCEIVSEYTDSIRYFVSEEDNGVYDGFNKGIKLCSGDVLSILNSDDVFHDEYVLFDILNAFQDSKADIVIGDLLYVRRDNLMKIERIWRCGPFIQGAFVRGWHPPHPAFFVTQKVYSEYLNFNLNYKFAADFVVMHELLEIQKIKSHYINRNCIKMRLGGLTSKNLYNVWLGNLEISRYLSKQYKDFRPIIYLSKRLVPKLLDKLCQKFHN